MEKAKRNHFTLFAKNAQQFTDNKNQQTVMVACILKGHGVLIYYKFEDSIHFIGINFVKSSFDEDEVDVLLHY